MLRAYGLIDTRLYRFRTVLFGLFLASTRLRYRLLARRVAREIKQYRDAGVAVAGVVGIGASPSCGVHTTLDMRRSFETIAACPLAAVDRAMINERVVTACRVPGEGLFVRALRKQLRRRKIEIPFLEHDLIAEMQGREQPLDLRTDEPSGCSGPDRPALVSKRSRSLRPRAQLYPVCLIQSARSNYGARLRRGLVAERAALAQTWTIDTADPSEVRCSTQLSGRRTGPRMPSEPSPTRRRWQPAKERCFLSCTSSRSRELPTAEGDSAVDSGQSGSHPNVREVLGDLSQQGLNAILKVVDFVGPQPAQGIADIAAEVDADVIVVGTRGHSAIGGLLVGSVTQHLLHVAPCPVLAVPPPLTQRSDARQRAIRRMREAEIPGHARSWTPRACSRRSLMPSGWLWFSRGGLAGR